MDKLITFERDTDNRWYAVLPEWEGEREELEMVQGADIMLDILSMNFNDNHDRIQLVLSTELPTGKYDRFLTLNSIPDNSSCGMNYMCIGVELKFPVWLCDVTTFVFGKFPETIYVLY
ncbi:gp55 [Sphingomonas phage PAU]|uniref:gp55 n=1 Tax=Sphingomonas phage PAU TaxID=1150991 RepID=UPI00025731C1|nr:gp55 [Sphingomonas phage PAU]AFF28053.1 gp55 [Sphingomonas phage PAU]